MDAGRDRGNAVVKVYVEGGGESKSLQIECRRGFRELLEKAGFKGHGKAPAIAACGSRRFAYDDYCIAVAKGEDAMLLVDSEAPVAAQHQAGAFTSWRPWQHLKSRQGDGWDKPAKAGDMDCHLMVNVMESWLLADRDALQQFFGQGFRDTALPAPGRPIESVTKDDIYNALKQATRNCKTKTEYGKGEHSFKLLAKIDPFKVTAASPWAMRFVDELKKKMGI